MLQVPRDATRKVFRSQCFGLGFLVTRRTLCSSRTRWFARNVMLENEQWKAKVKGVNSKKTTSRQERIDRANLGNRSKLQQLDNKFGIFNKKVTRVLDLGYVPGNWTEFARQRLCQVHDIEEENFHKTCHILGFDILFGTPPQGVSSMQGNIYSKSAHKLISTHFKDIALRKEVEVLKTKNEDLEEFRQSYFFKEQNETLIEQQVSELSEDMNELTLQDVQGKSKSHLDYKPHLILSDLSAPFMQDKGFFNNTNTKPYLRIGANSVLNRPITEEEKASIDLADAALVLACDVLAKGGCLVLRLSKINDNDPEIDLLQSRLAKVFNRVHTWNRDVSYDRQNKPSDSFFVCLDKIDDVCNKKDVFTI